MATKTQEYLKILAEGGDAPTDCCMTKTQSLIAEAIERINNLGGGIVDLTPYFDIQTFTLDVDAVTPIIEEGGHMYILNFPPMAPGGQAVTIPFVTGSIQDGKIVFAGPVTGDGTPGANMTLKVLNLKFDQQTGLIDVSSMNPTTAYLSLDGSGAIAQPMYPLTITVNGTTYQYDNTGPCDIVIS